MSYNSDMQRHKANIGRLVGHDVSGRYSYVVSEDELVNAWIQMKDELRYPLMMDSKNRRAIVYNKKGLDKQIQNMINNTIISNIHLLEGMVMKDVINLLNSIKLNANGTFVLGNVNGSNQTVNLFVNAMTNGFINGIGKIVDDITSVEDY